MPGLNPSPVPRTGWRAVNWGLLWLVAWAWSPPVLAIPAFARKYETSCQTCHVAFPKLAPFGEAFRRNGYRYPAGEEEDARKAQVIPLGQDAHKKVWPRAVWPGDLPGGVPLAVRVYSQATISPEEDPKLSFRDVGGFIGLSGAATLGQRFAGWAGVGIRANGAETTLELERVFVLLKGFEAPWLNLRVGRFEPQLLQVTSHRTLGLPPWISSSRIKDNAFTLEPSQLGLELSGVSGFGRVEYALGVVEGAGNRLNQAKDYYGRIGGKLGGMRLDGVGGAKEADPWREQSVAMGLFAYAGHAALGDPALATQDDRFRLLGLDLSAIWRDFNLLAALMLEHHERPSLAEPFEALDAWHIFTQLDYVALPWLVPSVRYERRTLGHDATEDRISTMIYALVQANVRAQLIAALERQGHHGFAASEIQAGLMVAF